MFSPFGKIVYFQKERDYAFIEYDNVLSAEEAIKKMNDQMVKGLKIMV